MDKEKMMKIRKRMLLTLYEFRLSHGKEPMEIGNFPIEEEDKYTYGRFNLEYLVDGGYIEKTQIREGGSERPGYIITSEGIELYESQYFK